MPRDHREGGRDRDRLAQIRTALSSHQFASDSAAEDALSYFGGKLKIGGKLYISVLGLHSELSEGYAASEATIDQRYAELAPSLARKYNIHQPVCLYTERNLFMLLLEAGASVLRTLTTTHGNVKGVAVRV